MSIYFRPLMLLGYKTSYVLTWTIDFLSMYKPLLLNTKKVYKILTECTSLQTN